MKEALAIVKTEHAGKYLTQLCKHFAHKVDVSVDGNHGECRFICGTAILTPTTANCGSASYRLTRRNCAKRSRWSNDILSSSRFEKPSMPCDGNR